MEQFLEERRHLTLLIEEENKEAMPAAAVAAMLWTCGDATMQLKSVTLQVDHFISCIRHDMMMREKIWIVGVMVLVHAWHNCVHCLVM